MTDDIQGGQLEEVLEELDEQLEELESDFSDNEE